MKNNKYPIITSSLFEKKRACDKLIKESTPSKEFYFLLVAASFLAASGIAVDSPAIIIGAMLIAPLLSSFLVIGLGIVISNSNLSLKRAITTLKALAVSIFTAFVASFFLRFKEIDPQLLIKESFVEFLFISFAAGLVGTYIWVRSDLQNIASGVLVAVTILPPLASFGLGMGLLNKEVISNSFLFFTINSFGLLLGSIVMFSLFGFASDLGSIEETVEEKLEEYEKKED